MVDKASGRIWPLDKAAQRERTAKPRQQKNKAIPAKKIEALDALVRPFWEKQPGLRGNTNRTANDVAPDMLSKLRAIDPARYPADEDDKKAKWKAARWIRGALSKTTVWKEMNLPL